MTKEEILDKYDYGYPDELYHGRVYEAMEEYAQQEVDSNSKAILKVVFNAIGLPNYDINNITLGEIEEAIKSQINNR